MADRAYLPFSLEETWQKLEETVRWNIENASANRIISIDASIYESAGASIVQELSFALSTAICYIKHLQDAGFTIEELAPLFQ